MCVCVVFPHINIVCAFSSVQMKFCVSSAWSHALPATAWETLVPSFRAPSTCPSTSILIMMFFTMTISALIKTQERAREREAWAMCFMCFGFFLWTKLQANFADFSKWRQKISSGAEKRLKLYTWKLFIYLPDSLFRTLRILYLEPLNQIVSSTPDKLWKLCQECNRIFKSA